jgi:hypothetical protein
MAPNGNDSIPPAVASEMVAIAKGCMVVKSRLANRALATLAVLAASVLEASVLSLTGAAVSAQKVPSCIHVCWYTRVLTPRPINYQN